MRSLRVHVFMGQEFSENSKDREKEDAHLPYQEGLPIKQPIGLAALTVKGQLGGKAPACGIKRVVERYQESISFSL